MTMLRAFFSSIPYDAEQQDEDHYKTIFYLLVRIATPFVTATEARSAAGRSDAVIETDDAVYVFEFLFKPSEAPNLFGHFRGAKRNPPA